ncbi:hypothetical protein [Edaphovirga cremea]|jgi:purine nucleoside phosphorylase|uniref:hypothetical protein n=1 Tax=Edaphovirga cremea TaxID=2267246 RepID=UPI000DEF6635|nr:hypothetical protein [Edaphovirga cremea]
MFKKVLLVAIIAGSALTSVAQAADQQAEQAKANFEKTMVKPCEGKKAGDQVTVVTRKGMSVLATCKLTAIVDVK